MSSMARELIDDTLPKDDRGAGSYSQYRFVLVPRNARVTLRLANSNPYQEELQRIVDSGERTLETAISRRTQAQEGADAPIEIRLFAGNRVSGVVGAVPRGLESVVDEALSRLEGRGQRVRIPARIAKSRGGWRVDLLMGLTK